MKKNSTLITCNESIKSSIFEVAYIYEFSLLNAKLYTLTKREIKTN